MNSLLCSFLNGLHTVIWIYTIIMLIYAVLSWIPDLRGRWSDAIGMLVEPVLAPVRRIIPPMMGLDLSFLVVIVLLQLVDNVIGRYAFNACYL